jgi:putative transposase
MGRPYSNDLRERVVGAVEQGGMSRHQAAAHFGVAISTAINRVKRFRQTASAAPGRMGGHKPRAISGVHRDWLIARCRDRAFTLRGLVGELAGERGLKVDYRSVWAFVHAEGLSYKKAFWPASKTGPTSRAAGRSGAVTSPGLIRHGSCLSTVELRRRSTGLIPTWHRFVVGDCVATDCSSKHPTVTGSG